MHHCTEVSVPINAAVLPEQLSAFRRAHSVSLRVPPRTGDGRVPVCPSSHLLPCVNGAQCSTAPCPPGQHQLLEQRSPPQPNPAAPEVPPPPTGAPRSDAGMSAGLGAPRAPPSCWGHSQVPALPFRSSIWQRSCSTSGRTRLQFPAPLQALWDTEAHSLVLPSPRKMSICRAQDGGSLSSAFMGRSCESQQHCTNPQSKGLWAELWDGLLVPFPSNSSWGLSSSTGEQKEKGRKSCTAPLMSHSSEHTLC